MTDSCVQISCVLSDIARACSFVVGVATQAGLSGRDVEHCYLVVDEICTNIIEHGSITTDCPEALIEVCCYAVPQGICIEIRDNSIEFDPLSFPLPDPSDGLDRRGDGGWGIYFLRKLMDDVRHDFANGQNKLTLVKKRTSEAVSLESVPTSENSEPSYTLTPHLQDQRVMMISLEGRYTGVIAEAVGDDVAHLLQQGVKWFIMDCAGATGLSSAGLKHLVKLSQRVQDRKGKIIFSGVPMQIEELFGLVGLDLIFTMVETTDQALRELQKKP